MYASYTTGEHELSNDQQDALIATFWKGVSTAVLNCRRPGMMGCRAKNDVIADESQGLPTHRHETFRVNTYLQPGRSVFCANTSEEELRSERTEAAKVAPLSNNSGTTLQCSRGESVHIVALIDASIATFIADEKPLRNGPGKATLGRSSSHVTTVTGADVLLPSADTVSTKTCVPGSMVPPGMEMRG